MPKLSGQLEFPTVKQAIKKPVVQQNQINEAPAVDPQKGVNLSGIKKLGGTLMNGFGNNIVDGVKKGGSQLLSGTLNTLGIKPSDPPSTSNAVAPTSTIPELTQAPKQVESKIESATQAKPVEQQQVKKAVDPTKQIEGVQTPTIDPDAQNNLNAMTKFAVDSLNAKTDPQSTAIFNNALMKFGLFNQAQRDLMQQQINNNPDLAGQPTGNAMLAMLARDSGFQVGELLTDLSIQSADKIRQLNQFGFNALSQITNHKETKKAQIRNELLKAGDFEGYAAQFKTDTGISINISDIKELSPATQNAVATNMDLMNRQLGSGNVDEARKTFALIQALSPKAFGGQDFDTLGFGDDSYLIKSGINTEIENQIRIDVAQGDFAQAIEGLTRLEPDEQKRIDAGKELIAGGDIDKINDMLEKAGFEPVNDLMELIGREEELYFAKNISEMKGNLGKSTIDSGVDFFTSELKKIDPNILIDPDAQKLIRSFVFDLNTGGNIKVDDQGNVIIDPNDSTFPWDKDSVSSHQFYSWGTMDANGQMTNPRELYSDDNPQQGQNTAIGRYNADMDDKWESYTMNTASADRLSPEAWFAATKGGTQDVDKSLIPGGVGKPTGSSLISDLDKQALFAEIGTMNQTEFDNRISTDDAFRNTVIGSATIFDNNDAFKNSTRETLRTDLLNGNTKGILKIGDTPFKIDRGSLDKNLTVDGEPAAKLISIDPETGKRSDISASIMLDGVNRGKVLWSLKGDKSEYVTLEEYIERKGL